MIDSPVSCNTLKSMEFNYVYNQNEVDYGYKIVVAQNNNKLIFIVSQLGKINPRYKMLEVWGNINRIKTLFSAEHIIQFVYLDLLVELGSNKDYIFQWVIEIEDTENMKDSLLILDFDTMDKKSREIIVDYCEMRKQFFNNTKLNNNQKIEIFTGSLIQNSIDDTQINNLTKYFTVSLRKFASRKNGIASNMIT